MAALFIQASVAVSENTRERSAACSEAYTAFGDYCHLFSFLYRSLQARAIRETEDKNYMFNSYAGSCNGTRY